jgi:flavin-dependent dehydrogenase
VKKESIKTKYPATARYNRIVGSGNETVRIAGAGPAGLSCAVALAQAGRAAVVFEAGAVPAAALADGLELLENWSEEGDALELFNALGLGVRASAVQQAELFDGELRPTPVASRRPFAYLVPRGTVEGSLDTVLLARARELGVEIRFGERRDFSEVDVLATGPSAPDLLAKQMVFATGAEDRVQLLFDPVRTPGGFAWLFVAEGVGTLGCLVARDRRHLDQHFDDVLTRFRRVSNFSVSGDRTAIGRVSCVVPGSSQAGGCRVIGGAAGSRDLLFGLGLRGALADGLLAAESIAGGKSFDALRDELALPLTRASLAARFRYERMSDAGIARALARCGRGDFRERLHRCLRPSFGSEAAAIFARAAWRPPESCAHPLPAHWCRRIETF